MPSESTTPSDEVLTEWNVPGIEPEATTHISAMPGRATVIVGANGAGKSALGYWFESSAGTAEVHRLIAHRRLWFEHAGPSVTPADRASLATNTKAWSMQPDSRYLDHAQTQRASLVLFDLLARENFQNAESVRQLRDGEISSADDLDVSIVQRVNSILVEGGLAITIKLTDTGSFAAVNFPKGATYPITFMSDGEKSALLLAAEVLTCAVNSIVIIDEPERHLHRSISAQLIAAVIDARPDCHFIILTHDLDLSFALPTSATDVFSLLDSTWDGQQVTGFQLKSVDETAALPDEVRRAILGGKSKLLFVEGDSSSLTRVFTEFFTQVGLLAPLDRANKSSVRFQACVRAKLTTG